MCLVLLLLMAILTSECTSIDKGGSTGLEFIVAFPENIAYYHPHEAQNQVWITALHNGTVVTIKSRGDLLDTLMLQAGDTHRFTPHAHLEMNRLKVNDKTLLISSTKIISAHLVYLKSQSLQTALLISSDRLSSQYRLPPVPPIQGTSRPISQVTQQMVERSPFRLVIVNTGHTNQVNVTGGNPQNLLLKPYEVAWMWLQEEEPTPAVSAQQKVALFFGHSCSSWYNCSCGMLLSVVAPPTDREEIFYVPSFLTQSTENQTLVLLSSSPSPQVRTLNPTSPALTTTGPILLYRPGLLLPLIPESEFAACFFVDSVPDSRNYAVIVVREDQVGGVHVGAVAVNTSQWQRLHGTNFVSTHVDLHSNQRVIWHKSSKMAVYLVGDKDSVWFGNPAAAISTTPDSRGCAMIPEVLLTGPITYSWQEAVAFCKDHDLELISFSSLKMQQQIYQQLSQTSGDQLWIGLRRSSQTGHWYWLDQDPVSHTDWRGAEPENTQDGQCAMMRREGGGDFDWSGENCCSPGHPLCYSSAIYFNAKGETHSN